METDGNSKEELGENILFKTRPGRREGAGQAGQRQVNKPKVGLSHCNGGDMGMACGINIIKL